MLYQKIQKIMSDDEFFDELFRENFNDEYTTRLNEEDYKEIRSSWKDDHFLEGEAELYVLKNIVDEDELENALNEIVQENNTESLDHIIFLNNMNLLDKFNLLMSEFSLSEKDIIDKIEEKTQKSNPSFNP